ncbi:MAG: ornithine cyclodeaminase family protein [Lachnospiraceae bacterium]
MLILNKADIEKTVDLNRMMDTIEETYRIFGKGDYYMPPRPVVEHENKTLLYMPCYTKDSMGTKILTIFPENSNLGLPSIDGVVLLNDYETGKPEAMLDGQMVTAFRTGAVGGVAVRHLSRKDCHTVGIVGAGVQGFYQALYACVARDIHTVYVYNHGSRDITAYGKRLEETIGNSVKVVLCKTIEELVKASDIICTTTPSATPVLPEEEKLLEGKCIVAIGSYTPDMKEIPDVIWNLVDDVYIELPYACEESGDLSQPLAKGLFTMDRVKYMHDYLANEALEEVVTKKTTYFKSVGMGLFDICVAKKLMEDAKEKGYGQEICF